MQSLAQFMADASGGSATIEAIAIGTFAFVLALLLLAATTSAVR